MKANQQEMERVGVNMGMHPLGEEILPKSQGIWTNGPVESKRPGCYQYVFNRRFVEEKEVMEALNVNRKTLQALLGKVNISVLVMKNRRWIMREDLERFMEEGMEKVGI